MLGRMIDIGPFPPWVAPGLLIALGLWLLVPLAVRKFSKMFHLGKYDAQKTFIRGHKKKRN